MTKQAKDFKNDLKIRILSVSKRINRAQGGKSSHTSTACNFKSDFMEEMTKCMHSQSHDTFNAVKILIFIKYLSSTLYGW